MITVPFYYYAAMDDEYFHSEVKKSTSLPVARKKLSRLMDDMRYGAGIIASDPNLEKEIGTINGRAGPVVNGKMLPDYYIWYPKGRKQEYIIKKDGNVVLWNGGRQQVIELYQLKKL